MSSSASKASPRVGSVDDLVGYFRSAETPVADFRVGTEHEKIGVYRDITAYAVLLREIRDNRKEIELLREAVGCNVVTRRQTARMLGKSERTIARMEDRGDLPRANITAPGVWYDFETVLDLQRASQNGSPR